MEFLGNWIWDWHDQNDIKSGLTAASFKFEKALDMILFLKPGASTPDNGNPIIQIINDDHQNIGLWVLWI